MLPGVVDDPPRSAEAQAWEDFGREFLERHSGIDVINYTVGEDTCANHGPLARDAAWNPLHVGAVGPVDLGVTHAGLHRSGIASTGTGRGR